MGCAECRSNRISLGSSDCSFGAGSHNTARDRKPICAKLLQKVTGLAVITNCFLLPSYCQRFSEFIRVCYNTLKRKMGNYNSKDGAEDEMLTLHNEAIPSRSTANARNNPSSVSPQLYASQTQPSASTADSQQGYDGDMDNIVPTVFKVRGSRVASPLGLSSLSAFSPPTQAPPPRTQTRISSTTVQFASAVGARRQKCVHYRNIQ